MYAPINTRALHVYNERKGPMTPLSVMILKPGKYGPDGAVERFLRGFMPNATLRHMAALTPTQINGRPVRVTLVDEYVQTDLKYLRSLNGGECDLLAIVGTQSHQFHRGLDLAAYARSRGVRNTIIGGPHPMTCDTTQMHESGVSFALAEGELIWPAILNDAAKGTIQPVYGKGQRWAKELTAGPIPPPSRRDMRRYLIPMLGVYPSRGCPYDCSFCSVIQVTGQIIRDEDVEVTLATIANAIGAGVKKIMFTSDNFNKITGVKELLRQMKKWGLRIDFFAQCDSQVIKDPELVSLMAAAGCKTIFVGVESFDREVLKGANKNHNHPEKYPEIIRLCHEYGISTFFSNIIGFPEQGEDGVREHLERLIEIKPDFASFYILTPFPGSRQYADFLRDGLITDPNMDRFDANHPVWTHPRLSHDDLRRLLRECYAEFFTARSIASRVAYWGWQGKSASLSRGLFYTAGAFHRYSASRNIHPMAGGAWRVRLDSDSDYAHLRRSTYGFDLAPLPARLGFSEADQEFMVNAT